MISQCPLIRRAIIFLVMIIVSCSNQTMDGRQREEARPSRPIEEVLKEHTGRLMSIPGVLGAAEGLCAGKPCIKVFVSEKTVALEQKIPDVFDGYPVEVHHTGEIQALPDEQDEPHQGN